MDVQIKKTIKAGNSSAVVLPRAWLNKEVRIELVKKTPETILHDVLEILKKNIDLASVIGVYLVGSYARGEAKKRSDIDILIKVRKGKKFSLLDLVGLQMELEEKLGKKVDLLTYNGISPYLKKYIMEDEIKII